MDSFEFEDFVADLTTVTEEEIDDLAVLTVGLRFLRRSIRFRCVLSATLISVKIDRIKLELFISLFINENTSIDYVPYGYFF